MMNLVEPTAGTLVTVELRNSRRLHGKLAPSPDGKVLMLVQPSRTRGIDCRDVLDVQSREWSSS